ncbi:MAG: hypothetical protein K2P14_05040 [Anaeroplasmataceae bacterium]|nr:hypothetical protein [Anaeroplasmataceae bacterium]
MSKKEDLLKEINIAEAEIEKLEQKRLRSQSSIIEAWIDKEEPQESEKKYFKTLSSLIKLQREKLQMLSDELALLKDKK